MQLELEDGGFRWYRVVGPDEFDMASDYVSMDSPLGKSLLGKRLDDEITVTLPAGGARGRSYATAAGDRASPPGARRRECS